MKLVLPWLTEVVKDPKKIQKLIEERALQDWYEEHTEAAELPTKKDDSTFKFLATEKRRVRAFLSQLNDLERVVVYLKFWEDLLAYEIAELLEISETTIHLILKEAVKKLRSLYFMEMSKAQALSPASA